MILTEIVPACTMSRHRGAREASTIENCPRKHPRVRHPFGRIVGLVPLVVRKRCIVRETVTRPPVKPLPATNRALIQPASQSDPFRSRLAPPHHHTRVCYQNEAMAVAAVVIEPGRIRQSQRQRGICNAPGVSAPYAGIRDEMTSARRPVPYACDTSFRAVQSNKYQGGSLKDPKL